MTIFGMDYQIFWAVVFGIPAVVLGGGVWYELHKIRKSMEKKAVRYQDDDLFDARVK